MATRQGRAAVKRSQNTKPHVGQYRGPQKRSNEIALASVADELSDASGGPIGGSAEMTMKPPNLEYVYNG